MLNMNLISLYERRDATLIWHEQRLILALRLRGRYNLFASNAILASISYVYFPDQKWPGLITNLFTLIGSVIGQLLFGFLADYMGRTRLYGIELVLVIVSTIGVATSSYGSEGDMSYVALFTWVSINTFDSNWVEWPF